MESVDYIPCQSITFAAPGYSPCTSGPSSSRPSGRSGRCRHFFLYLKTLYRCPPLGSSNSLNLVCSSILWDTLFKSNPFIFTCNPLGFLHLVTFHWMSHTYTRIRAGSSSQRTPGLRESWLWEEPWGTVQWFSVRGGTPPPTPGHLEILGEASLAITMTACVTST